MSSMKETWILFSTWKKDHTSHKSSLSLIHYQIPLVDFPCLFIFNGTRTKKNPKWDERFIISLAHTLVNLEFQVKDNEVLDVNLLGRFKILVENIVTDDTISDSFMMENSFKKKSEQSNKVIWEWVF